MTSAGPPTSSEEVETLGMLLDAGSAPTASPSDLYDPNTGRALLVPGSPINRRPPAPDALRMGIIDSGVLPDHPQLRNLVVSMRDFTGNDPIDRIGHGTICAILLVASTNPGSVCLDDTALVSAKVTDPDGKIKLEHVIEAIHWMASQNVRLVNMSLGFIGTRNRYTGLCEVIGQYPKIAFVAAAGNFGWNVSTYPADCGVPNLLSVGGFNDGKLSPTTGQASVYTNDRVELFPAQILGLDREG